MNILLSLILALAQTFPFPGPRNVALAASPITLTGDTCSNVGTSTGTSVTCTWSTAPSVGQTIHWGVYTFSAPSTFTVTDSSGNTCTANGAQYSGTSFGTITYQLFDCFVIAGSPTTSTFTLSGSGSFPVISGYSTTGGVGAVDGTPGTASVTSSTTISATINPTGSTDLSNCIVASGGGSTIGAGSGYALINTVNTNNTGEYKILTASGSQTATAAALSGAFSADLICGTYK